MTKKESDHAYYIKNRERLLEKNKLYAKENREKLREKSTLRMRRFSQTPKGFYKTIKGNALKRKISILSQEEFLSWYSQQEKKCFYCDIPENLLLGEFSKICGRETKRLSIDRLSSDIGYESENMVLCCLRCNIIKNNFFTVEEMLEIGKKNVKPKWNTIC